MIGSAVLTRCRVVADRRTDVSVTLRVYSEVVEMCGPDEWHAMRRDVRVKVAITKHKDDEDTSSTIYNAMDLRNPVLDFQRTEGNENIVDQVHT